MSAFKWARIALLLAGEDRHAPYYREAIEHAGLRHEPVDASCISDLARIDVLLLAGYGELTPEQNTTICNWVRGGGNVVCSGSTWGLESILGISEPLVHASNETMAREKDDRLWPEGADHARFFGGTLGSSAGCETIAITTAKKVALSRRKV